MKYLSFGIIKSKEIEDANSCCAP